MYVQSSHLRRHFAQSHELLEKEVTECPNCGQGFSNRTNMLRHYRIAHEHAKTYTCPHCEERFLKKAQLKVHIYTHTGEHPQKCPDCDAGFQNLKQLRRHRSAEHKRESKKCSDCDRAFQTWTELVAHRKEKHATLFKCPDCDKQFYAKCRLKIHSLSHRSKEEIEDQLHRCSYAGCDKSYKKRSNLVTHIRQKHLDETFKCEECGRMFRTKQKRTLHIRNTHGNEDSVVDKKNTKSQQNSGDLPTVRAKRKDFGLPKRSTLSLLTGFKFDAKTEKLILAGEGHRLYVECPPVNCGQESATDTDSEANSIVSNYVY